MLSQVLLDRVSPLIDERGERAALSILAWGWVQYSPPLKPVARRVAINVNDRGSEFALNDRPVTLFFYYY